MSLSFSLQSLSSQLNTPIFAFPLQFTNQCRSPLLRRDGGAILKLSWRQGLVAARPANPVTPCLVTATENKIDPKTPNKTNKRLLNSSPVPSNGKIDVLSPQQDQFSNEMKTASKEEHGHVLLERNSLNDHLNRINEEINKLKNHADLLKGEVDKLLSYSNSAIRTADQSYELKRNKNNGKATKKANNSSLLTAEDMLGDRSNPGKNRKRRGSPDDTDVDTRRVKPRLEEN